MLSIRRIGIDTYPENTAFLLRKGNGYAAEQFQALRKIVIGHDTGSILATLAVVDDPELIGPSEIGLGEQAFRRLGQPEGTLVSVAQATEPRGGQAQDRRRHVG